ncbi:MAG: DUF192 domain-containing protein [Fimbriimonadaceae bacterium]|nr:DUF192 domain-containing protein [Fimbriimonadaceae bacterium]
MARFVNRTRGTTLAAQGVLATGFWLRLRGLMFRRAFAPFDGLWLEPTSSIHMFWVCFAIDCVWVDAAGVVVKTTAALRPWRLDFARGAQAVLELPSGSITRSGTAVGDQIAVEPA